MIWYCPLHQQCIAAPWSVHDAHVSMYMCLRYDGNAVWLVLYAGALLNLITRRLVISPACSKALLSSASLVLRFHVHVHS